MKATLFIIFQLFLFVTVTANPLAGKHDPERNFEVFWQLFDKNYAHFETRKVDWNRQYQLYRSKVSTKTTPDELLAIFNEMVAPLKDGHVAISPTGDLPASAKYAPFYQEFPTKALQSQFHEVTRNVLSEQGFGPIKKFNSAPYDIGGYCRSAEYGYLRVNGFGGISLAEFGRQLDDMVTEFADIKGLIIDIRINGGGSPAYLNALAGRLTQVKRLVGYGRSRTSKGKYPYTPWTAYHIAPTGKTQLLKPTVVLTSGATMSAGDHCAMYLSELPYVQMIGEPTNGIFSPMLGKKLPNGWEISLSNGQSVNSKRVSYEGKGVPVAIAAVHRRSDMLLGVDRGLQEAFSFFKNDQNEMVTNAICYEQLALNFYADSLLPNKVYGDVTAYSTGLVEEDATLLAPFASKCKSLKASNAAVENRVLKEEEADSEFHNENVQRRFYVNIPHPVKVKKWRPFGKRNGRRLTVAHHITIGGNNYVRLHLSQGGWKGETVLVVLDKAGKVVEHCFLSYNYLSGQFY